MTKPTGEDNPAGRSCSVKAQEDPGFRQGLNPRRQFEATSPLPERTPPSAPPRGRATRRGLHATQTAEPRRTRTGSWLPSPLRNIGPGSP